MFIDKNDIAKLKNEITGKRIAGIDFGEKRIGLAVTDELHISIRPATTLQNNEETLWDKLERFIRDERISIVILGFPVTLDGSEIPLHGHIKKFAREINQRYGLSVYFTDESYTSQNAGAAMLKIGKNKKYKETRGNLDKFAAAEILNEFLIFIEG